MVPQLEQEIQIGGCKGVNEDILEHLGSALGRIDPVVVGLHELELAFCFGEKFFDIFCCLIIHDNYFWFETFSRQFIKCNFIGVKNSFIVKAGDGKSKDGVQIVMIDNKEAHTTIVWHEQEVSC
jgi:hypothetical protein